MLDRSFRQVFADLSTFFLIVAAVVLPLHLAHSYHYRHVIEVAELHDEIATFPSDRTVRDVGATELDSYRTSLLVLAALELLLIPVLLRPVRATIRDRRQGRVPTVIRSWLTGWNSGGSYLRSLLTRPGPLIAAGAVAVGIGLLAEMVGLLLAQPLGDATAWVGVGLAAALARALAAPFFLVTWALSAAGTKADRLASRRANDGRKQGNNG